MPTVVASDNFNRADSGTLGSNWTDVTIIGFPTGFQIVSNKAEPRNFGATQINYWNANSFDPNQYSQGVVTDDPYDMGLVVRATAPGGAAQGYVLQTGRGGSLTVGGIFTGAGTATPFVTFGSTYAVAGDTIRFESEDSGGNVVLRAFINGVQIGTDYVDSVYKYASGAPGIFGSYTGFDDFDSWEGGNLGGGGGDTYPGYYGSTRGWF